MDRIPLRRVHGFLSIALLLAALAVGAGCGLPAEGTNFEVPEAATVEEPGRNLLENRVVMARPEAFAELERPPVVFDHRRHTEALKEEGCRGCHPADAEGNVDYQYVEWREFPNRRALIDAYHQKCMKCHYEGVTDEGTKVRALSCGECHVETAAYETLEWYRATFDHFHHIDAMEKGCDTCHHRYDEEQKKLVYEKGQEEACGNCHKGRPEENRDSLRRVGHTSCIGCHEEKYLAGEIKLDPHECRQCHRPEAKPVPEAREIVARTYQAQPTQLLISYPGSILPPVPFDHEKHDPKKECSKCCHHFHVRTLVATDTRFQETADSCQQCHAQSEVSVRAGCVQADKLYHDAESPNSCVGCHTEQNKETVKEEEKRPVTCKGCHTGDVAAVQPVEMEKAGPPDEEKGPETYIIARMSRKYLPVKFPHALHTKMITNCDSCHHHGPEKEWPTCNTCHGAPLDFMKLTKPRLISAYHRMCMGCHRSMGTGPVACTKCHEERETVYPTGQRLQTTKAPEPYVAPEL